jgi:Na+-driven multidrug efflux pump
MAILLAAALAYCALSVLTMYMIVLHRERTIVIVNIVSVAVYAVAAFLLIPSLAALGAALATALAYVVNSLLLLWCCIHGALFASDEQP